MNLTEIASQAIADVAAQDERVTVQIMATSDIHTSGLSEIEPPDGGMLIFAGDIMGGGMDSDAAGERYLAEEFFPWCAKHPDTEIVATAGNHDKYLFRMWSRDKAIQWPPNVHYLIDRAITVKGLRLYGTPWCTKNRPGRFELSDHELADRFSQIPQNLDILISHSPPFIPGEKVDVFDGYHDGSPELAEAILAKKPRLVICGHVHGGSRKPVTLGSSTVINVARVEGDRSVAAYKPVTVSYTMDVV